MPPSLPLIRVAVLGVTNLFAFLVLALAAYTLSRTSVIYFTYSALGVAVGVIHLVSVTAMITVGRIRDGALTSKVSVEVGWLSFICVLWLSTGAHTAVAIGALFCIADDFCGVTQAIAAFAFFNWFILLVYIMALIGAVVRASQAGRNLWMSDVKEIQWAQGPGQEKGIINSPGSAVPTYPPGSIPLGAHVMPQYQPQPNYQPNHPQPQYGVPQV